MFKYNADVSSDPCLMPLPVYSGAQVQAPAGWQMLVWQSMLVHYFNMLYIPQILRKEIIVLTKT